ncbi:HK97 gp10 family phage protein [Fusobacterium mortiferum]|uniref:HK97 gp10 family phage protein n=1 Tax=Fusobacterium mortiferum TaxID=850 RepID=A0ABS2G225_FUSMR|nr:HK97 gp10 family phage protein [Fusobacterium mortiferum]MBM6875456.1 HK97 gp10 family phage protein [Fusobacterium mortiferum]
MGRAVRVNIDGLKKLKEKLEEQQNQLDNYMKLLASDIAALLLKKVIKRTPVGVYAHKTGGNLRRGWTVGEVVKTNNGYKVEVINSVEYASYVEYGHRTRNHKGWVPGRFMLTISENEIRDNLESIIQKRLKVILEKMKNA